MIYHFSCKNKNEKIEKFFAKLHDKTEYLIHIKLWLVFSKC